MIIIVAVASILILTAFARIAGRSLTFAVCPVCAGVLLTWAWLLGARFAGYAIDPVVPALLMGGSVVGAAYWLEKKFWRPADAPLLFKTFFMSVGFAAAYALGEQRWTELVIALALLAIVAYAFLPARAARAGAAAALEKKMEDCC